MIVRFVADGLLLITQPDHAQLAGRIMERCVTLVERPRRDSILRALAEHDHGWGTADETPAIDAGGAVVDFVNAPLSVRQGAWPRTLANLAGDPWAAALVAQHALTVYDRFRLDPEWTSFFDGVAAARNRLVLATGRPLADLTSDYPFVRLGDLISLAFCTGTTAAHRFGEWTVQLSGTRVTVKPDPFGGATIPIEVTAKQIPHPPFRSTAALHHALSVATLTALRGEAGGG